MTSEIPPEKFLEISVACHTSRLVFFLIRILKISCRFKNSDFLKFELIAWIKFQYGYFLAVFGNKNDFRRASST